MNALQPIQRDELHPELRPWIEGMLAERCFNFRQLERGELWGRKEWPFANLDEVVQYFVLHDPVYFAESTFTERDSDDRATWRLWDYQKASMRYRGNVIHEDAAEVGKTREIVALVVWMLLARRGDQLVGGALDIHSTDIFNEVEWQLTANPWLEAQINWEEKKKKPYPQIQAKNGNRVFFRPAGIDGTAFRGVHARGAIYLDEAVKVKSGQAWGNFFSRAKPGAEIRLYSVPDGDRSCKFFEIAQAAPVVEPDGSNLAQLRSATAALDIEGLEGQKFVRFRWPKSLMPEKFYNPARLAGWEEQYGPPDSAEYQHNVLGNWGDPEASIFPWNQLAPCLRYIPDYTAVRLLWDPAGGAIANAFKLRPGYHLTGPAGDEGPEVDDAASPTHTLANQRRLPLSDFDSVDTIEAVLREFFSPIPGALVAGIDPGSTSDPTEVLLFHDLHPTLRCVARVQLRQFTDPLKRLVLYALERIFGPSQGWGLDATGAGAPLQHELAAGSEDRAMAERFELGLSGFVYNAATLDLNPATGEPAVDPSTNKERRVSYLEQGVKLLVKAVQARHLELPYDPDFGLQFPGYTERRGASGRPTYGHNKKDHLVAAAIAAALRNFHLRHGSLAYAPVTFASVPRGGAHGFAPGANSAAISLAASFAAESFRGRSASINPARAHRGDRSAASGLREW